MKTEDGDYVPNIATNTLSDNAFNLKVQFLVGKVKDHQSHLDCESYTAIYTAVLYDCVY